MRTRYNRLRWIVCLAALLLCAIGGFKRDAMEVEQPMMAASSCVCAAEEAVGATLIAAPESDTFAHLRETNCWGISSTALHLRAAEGRTLSFGHTSQRIVRMAMANLPSHTATEEQRYVLCHAIASIRFHIGYFIYHRCQMRC